MRNIYSLLLSFAVLLIACSDNFHPRDREMKNWESIYKNHGISRGAFEVMDNAHERIQYYNIEGVSKRRPPASTFKIFLALVALETGIAPDETLVIPHDGVQYEISAWNQDMDMVQAMKTSSEPYFREIARRIGRPTLQMYLDTTRYGNMTLGQKVEDSWHDGSLLISPDEQVGFLLALYHDKLNFSQRTQRIVRRILPSEDSLSRRPLGYKMTYKTGTYRKDDSTFNCWLVGYFEDSLNNAHPYFFANNFDAPDSLDFAEINRMRMDITHQIFADIGLL